MDIVELIQNNGKCGFSFEVLPPLKGKGIVQIYNAIGSLASIGIYDNRVSVPLAARNSSIYSYTPNMTLNSQEKKLFKKGETYSLGLVFIRKNGVKSTVF